MRKLIHGEVIFYEVKGLPKGAKKVEVKKDHYIVGESETTGNDHRIAVKEGVDIYEKDGVLYLVNDVDTDIYCPNEKRHGRETIPPSIWVREISKEYDYFSQKLKPVAD